MEQLTRGDMEYSYGLPLTIERVRKAKKLGVYPINRVHQKRNKPGDTTPNISKTYKIYFPKIFIRVINQRVDRK